MTTVSPHSAALELFDFDREVYEMARDAAPRIFAVVEEYCVGTEDADAEVVAWGMAFEGGKSEVTRVGGHRRWTLVAPENAMRFFGRTEDTTARLVWIGEPESNGRSEAVA